MGIAILVTSILQTTYAADKIVYPIQEMSKLECRYQDFDTLSWNCKQSLPILETKNYKKYAKKNGGYNDYTRTYTVLWASSYKYGWDQWNGGHQWVDIATAKGTPVYAIADGKVIVAKTDIGWGKVVSIEHTINGKTVVSDYAHMSAIKVNKGDRVKAGKKIGEVGSTGNSTGNHLHFQIDLKAPFYPYYYDYKACPYSYYDISEKWVCFDELASHTIDPLLFLETNGAVLDQVKQNSSKIAKKAKNLSGIDSSIFYTYVYKESSSEDIKQVQRVYKDLGFYTGRVSGNYDDVEQSIVSYQIDRKVIENKHSLGAGYFGPKTRAQTKLDYDAHVKKWGKTTKVVTSKTSIKTEKISRVGLLSREEIEKREVDEFLKFHTINIKNTSKLNEVTIGKNTKITLEVLTRKGRGFRWTTPGNITLEINSKVATVFPNKFFYFDDGKRDIYIKWVKSGSTMLTIKLGTHTLKKITVRVGNVQEVKKQVQKSRGVQAGVLLVNKSSVIGESKTGLVLLRDNYGKKLIKKEYDWEFAINSNEKVLYCVKKWKLKDIRTIYRKKCRDTEFHETLVYNYNDTVGWILIFDYKVYDRSARLELVKTDTKRTLSARNIKGKNPKGLVSSYKYHDEIVSTLESWITNGINKWYFLEDRKLTQYDANVWIRNALNQIKKETQEWETKGKISQKILKISWNLGSNTKTISRQEFLDMTTKYLVLEDSLTGNISIDYRDLDDEKDKQANIFFNKDNTWKDKFGDNYFRPKAKITRWEWAYFLTKAIQINEKIFLASR